MGTGGRKINNEHINDIIDEINYSFASRESSIGGEQFKIIKNGASFELNMFNKTWVINIWEKLK